MKLFGAFVVLFLCFSPGRAEDWVEKTDAAPASDAGTASRPAAEDQAVNPSSLPGMEASATAPAPAEKAAASSAGAGLYEVRKGDTLWDLAEQFYREPFDWKRIWEANKADIRNPNLIYPDQRFRIPGQSAAPAAVETPVAPAVEEAAQPPAAPEAAEAPAPPAPPAPDRAPETVKASAPKPPAVSVRNFEKGALLVDRKWQGDGRIVGDPTRKNMLSMSDTVYLNIGASSGLRPRTRGLIYRKGRKIKDPKTGERLGVMATRVGVLEVTDDVRDNASTAVIVTSYEPIFVGDIVKLQD